MIVSREEAIKIKEIIDDNTEFGYTDWKVVCAEIDNIINQSPQLSDDVERLLEIVREQDYYDTNTTPLIISNELKQHIQAQANEIEELKELLKLEILLSRHHQYYTCKEYYDNNVNENVRKDLKRLKELRIKYINIKKLLEANSDEKNNNKY